MRQYFIILLGLFLVSCSDNQTHTFQGYIEGEYLYMAPSVPGHLDKLLVQRGEVIQPNQSLFLIEKTDELAQLHATQAQLQSSQATLKDMLVGKRPSELNTITAQINQAQSSKQLAVTNLKRDQKQYSIGAIPKSQLDNSQANYIIAVNQVNELQNDLITAKLPNRNQQIQSQKALVKYSEANVADAQWKLSQTKVQAPTSALVYDTLYNEGEWVSAGKPVVILLPPENLKIRFFAPETNLSQLRLGQRIKITCDGCQKNMHAKISYISDQAEYTSPLIYSNETRNKLIFRIEAKPEKPNLFKIHPGQPVEVIIHDN